jgi:hypothetical protein
VASVEVILAEEIFEQNESHMFSLCWAFKKDAGNTQKGEMAITLP